MRKQTITKQEKAALRKIGEIIKRDIATLNTTDDDFAWKAGVARSTIKAIKRGESNVRVGTLRKVVTAIGYDSLVGFLTIAGVRL